MLALLSTPLKKYKLNRLCVTRFEPMYELQLSNLQNEPGFLIREISVNDFDMIELRIRMEKRKARFQMIQSSFFL
jgi:hypothetical protein